MPRIGDSKKEASRLSPLNVPSQFGSAIRTSTTSPVRITIHYYVVQPLVVYRKYLLANPSPLLLPDSVYRNTC